MGAGEPKLSTDELCLEAISNSAKQIQPDFTIKGIRRRCAQKHRNSRRETAGWDLASHQEVSVFFLPGGMSLLIHSIRFSRRNLPSARNFLPTNQCLASGSAEGAGTITFNYFSIFHCGKNEIQPSLISFGFVGATPTPATNFPARRKNSASSRPPGSKSPFGSVNPPVNTSTSNQGVL